MNVTITILGFLLLPVTFGVALICPRKFLSWFVFLAVLPVGSVFLCSVRGFEFGVTGGFVGAAILVVVRLVVPPPAEHRNGDAAAMSHLRMRLMLWCGFCVLTGYLMPTLSAGRVFVSDPRGGMGVAGVVPLEFRMTNVTQITYLILNVSAAIAVSGWIAGSASRLAQTVNAVIRSGFLVVCIAAYQFVAVYAGWYFPYDVVNGNPQTAVTQTIRPYFVGGERFGKVYAPFSEPSTLSQYLIGLFMGCVYLWTVRQGGIRVRVLAVLSGLTLLLTVSTTGYVGLVVGGGLVLATMLRRRRLRAGLCGVCAVLATVIVIAYYALISIGHGDADSVVQAVTSATLEKTTSGSFEARTFVDRASLNALIETYGLGVGWGSTRASSLAINVLACGGLCGAALLGWFAKGLTQNMARQKRCPHLEFVKFVLYGNLIGGFIAVPDVNGAFLWVLIGGLIGGAALRRPTDSYRVLDSRCLEAAQ